MLKAVQGYFRTAARFRKQPTAKLPSLKNTYLVFGIVALVISVLWFPGWQTAAWFAVSLGWFYGSILARKEIRHRESESSLQN